MGFASAVGLMVASPSPTWRDTSVWLAILSGFWIVLVAVGSFALGGYLAGRVRSTWKASEDESNSATARMACSSGRSASCSARSLLWTTASDLCGGATAAAPPRDTAGAPSFLAYELDRLFRPDIAWIRSPRCRAEAGRIVMRGLGRQELPSQTIVRSSFASVAGSTGLPSRMRSGG